MLQNHQYLYPAILSRHILGNDSCLRPAGALSLLGLLVKSSQFRSQTPDAITDPQSETLDGRSCLIQAVC